VTRLGILTDATAAMLGEYDEYGSGKSLEYTYGYFDAVGVLREMIRNDNVQFDYTKSGGGAQDKSAENRRKLEAGIIRQLHKAEERVLEMVYYILVG
jgi:hypothetical protein